MSQEDEFTLGLFLHGTCIYNRIDEDNSRINYYCISCKRSVGNELYKRFGECPSCRLNSVIPLEGRNIFNRLQVEVLRERIILDTLRNFDFEEFDDLED